MAAPREPRYAAVWTSRRWCGIWRWWHWEVIRCRDGDVACQGRAWTRRGARRVAEQRAETLRLLALAPRHFPVDGAS